MRPPPPGVQLNALSMRVFEVLAEYTAFPWPILMTQARRCGRNPGALTREDLAEMIPYLVIGVERYTSPDKGARARVALRRLVDEHPNDGS
jgi:hypothetical protein